MAPGALLATAADADVIPLPEVHIPSLSDAPTTDAGGYTIPDTLLGAPRGIKLLVIGFGAAGINIAHVLGKPDNGIEVVCYEKNTVLGGTWYENVYPGCACDIPSVNYQYTWHPKPDWSSYYATSPEILGYFQDVVEKHDLTKFARLNHRVIGAWWNEVDGKWKIKVQRGDDPNDVFEDTGDVLINATGVLNNWKWPEVSGVEKFPVKLHSAAWDSSVDLKDKTVGIIGNGSSAVQIIPSIFPNIKKLKSFMRSSTWITAGFAQKYAGPNGANFQYSEEQKKQFREDPAAYLHYRKLVEAELNQRFKFIINGTPEQQEALDFARKEMARKLNGRQDLIDKMVPKNYAVGCRRPTPGNGYLECITDEEKCEVNFAGIQEINERGLITCDGKQHDFDVLICATGFDVSFRPRYPIVGAAGVSMSEKWKESPETYLSLTAPHFPNYFMINGPFGPYGHGSILPVIEMITRYIEKTLFKMQTEDIKSFVPKQAAVNDFKRHRELFLQRTAWSSPCRSWFKGGKAYGPILMWPGSRLHFFQALQRPRWEDYEWECREQSRFSYFGNGFCTREFDGGDVTWYIDGI
ncbi:FAD/NAD(P)-binding domain-containing protein [Lepidopterella palustris CBS 459.81]|uniref:FAD/NAD(P)-binding domain-containing protein n=1 Tax=Lepidopterella palustris CBS 459.81 TaxID=1314670 RepID=A0A8E2EBT7_9PEZI|nr:FAD/NAD(P)-binding domain-containing protein [Lepidopterella palustris CBS 459.81]